MIKEDVYQALENTEKIVLETDVSIFISDIISDTIQKMLIVKTFKEFLFKQINRICVFINKKNNAIPASFIVEIKRNISCRFFVFTTLKKLFCWILIFEYAIF